MLSARIDGLEIHIMIGRNEKHSMPKSHSKEAGLMTGHLLTIWDELRVLYVSTQPLDARLAGALSI